MVRNTGLTADRVTHVLFDYNNQDAVNKTLVENYWGATRLSQDIGIAANAAYQSNVVQIATGDWTLKPFQGSLSDIATDPNFPGILLKKFWRTTDQVAEDPRGTTGDQINEIDAPTDPFMHMNTRAGGAITEIGNQAFDLVHGPWTEGSVDSMAAIAVSTDQYSSAQGYLIRVSIPGVKTESKKAIFAFYFSGPSFFYNSLLPNLSHVDGYTGKVRFCLYFTGDGHISLFAKPIFEYSGFIPAGTSSVDPHLNITETGYVKIRDWSFGPNQTGSSTITCYLKEVPSRSGGGRSLEIISGYGSTVTNYGERKPGEKKAPYIANTQVISLVNTINTLTKYAPGFNKNSKVQIEYDNRYYIQASLNPADRVQFQVSILYYDNPLGIIRDEPFFIPFVSPDVTANITLRWMGSFLIGSTVNADKDGNYPNGISGTLFNAATGASLTTVSTSYNEAVFAAVPGQNTYFAQFALLSADKFNTPVFRGYVVQRDGTLADQTTTISNEGGIIRDVSITGAEYDISHETAKVTIDDPRNELPQLGFRSGIPTQIRTALSSTSGLSSVVFQGYAIKTSRRRVTSTSPAITKYIDKNGNENRRGIYPSDDWWRYESDMVGMWNRLNETFTETRFDLAEDPKTGQPHLVTDIVRTAFYWAGFPPEMVDVPYAATKFWPTGSGQRDDMLIEPLTRLSDWILRTVRDYLGGYVVFDANAGTQGMWRVFLPPRPPYFNMFNFHTKADSSGKDYGLFIDSNSYSANEDGSFSYQKDCGIVKGSYESYVKPPENNCVWVTGTGQLLNGYSGDVNENDGQSIYNPKSFNFGGLKTADPTSPDYLGRMVPLVICDPSLLGADQTSGQSPVKAINMVCRRYYDLTCHATSMVTFTAPMVFVYDHSVLNQASSNTAVVQPKPAMRNLRPLRFYDAVTIDNDVYLVRNCNPTYHKDFMQMARYELQKPPVLTV